MEKVENMNNGRPINKHTFDDGNHYGSNGGNASSSDNVQISAKASSNSLFPETTEFKNNKKDKKTEVKKTKED